MTRLAVLIPATLVLACSGMETSKEDVTKTSEFHYKLASNYYTDHNIAMTQRELYEALRINPNHAEAHFLKGFVLIGLDDLHGAETELREALRCNADHFEARNNLGTVLLAQGRFDEAIKTFQPLLETPLYPTPAFAHANIGWAWYQMGNLTEARRSTEMAVFLNPGFCLGYNSLGMIFRDMKNPRQAREQFEKAVKLCPKYAEGWYNLGVLLQGAAEMDAAEAAFAKCQEAAPDSPMGKRCAARHQ